MKRLKRLVLMSLCLISGMAAVGCGGTEESFKVEKIKVGELQVDGVLTLPKGEDKTPVVILVQGSGQSDMDETINENKPFKDIAEGLSKRGIATIRYNKRYFQYPEKAKANLTIQEEVLDDARDAIEFAASHKNIDSEKIYVLGHSLGGMLAPKIASDNNKVSGIISLAGSPRYLYEIILDQNKNLIEKSDASKEEKLQALEYVTKEIAKVKNIKDEKGESLGISNAYFKSLNSINTREIASKLDIPILVLQGDKDFQVFKDVDFKEWKEVLKNNEKSEFKSYANLNHLFMLSNGKEDITEYSEKSKVSPEVIEDITNFIK